MAKTPTGRVEQIGRFHKSKDVVQRRKEHNSKRQRSERLDESKVFVSTSDPEVPISRDKKKVFGPLWPTQFVTHVTSRLVIAVGVFASPTDCGTIGPMLDMVRQNINRQMETVYADAGYTSQSDIQMCIDLGVKLVAPVKENSFTKANREERQQSKGAVPMFRKCDFNIDYEEMKCECPNGQVASAVSYGSRKLAYGKSLKVFRFKFPETACSGCSLAHQCKSATTPSRTLRVTEGESIVAEHKRQMTPEVLAHCRSVRAQTAENAFADGKVRSGLDRLGCKSLVRTRAVTLLHVLAMNLKRLFRIRKTKEITP
jgi:hypothetical protein